MAKKASTPATKNKFSGSNRSLGARVAATNKWRDNYNPMYGLTVRRAVGLFESYARGDFADLMWTYAAPCMGIESADADLMALIERRTGAMVELDWNVKTADEQFPSFDSVLADEQNKALNELYYGIENLEDAFEHMALPSFRGFAHLEKVFNADFTISELAIINQWNVVRDGSTGDWKWNPEARQTSFSSLPDDYLLTPDRVLLREVARPINRIALLKVVRQNLSQKDWDAFIEIYGIPSGVVIAPAEISPDKMPEFLDSAEGISEGRPGALPNGSQYMANDSPRGINPFRDHLKFLQEQLILAGTGGLLTMLSAPGSGTLAGGAHSETFKTIARAEARKISAVFQRGIDREYLDRLFPGRPRLAYFELAANESIDPGTILDHASKAAMAGYQMDAIELSEKTGYTLTLKPQTQQNNLTPGTLKAQSLLNSESKLRGFAPSREHLSLLTEANANDFSPLTARLEKLQSADDADFADELKQLQADLPELLKQVGANDEAVKAWEQVLGKNLIKGISNEK